METGFYFWYPWLHPHFLTVKTIVWSWPSCSKIPASVSWSEVIPLKWLRIALLEPPLSCGLSFNVLFGHSLFMGQIYTGIDFVSTTFFSLVLPYLFVPAFFPPTVPASAFCLGTFLTCFPQICSLHINWQPVKSLSEHSNFFFRSHLCCNMSLLSQRLYIIRSEGKVAKASFSSSSLL